MLKNIDPLLGPELLRILREMGHGDQIALVDANYPSGRAAGKLVRMDGVTATQLLQAILSVMPLDQYVEHAAQTMQVVGDPEAVPEIVKQFRDIVARAEPQARTSTLERFAFYECVHKAFAVVATGELRQYGNILLRKGVILKNSP